ncbi:MAG: hypothetical protein B6247_31815 [Candidatus Parabeggiatoa sp. nov. 2]|nr:MAG: hypothetical protein B6247_31815 [Beggiatoa sp. 4572_84]
MLESKALALGYGVQSFSFGRTLFFIRRHTVIFIYKNVVVLPTIVIFWGRQSKHRLHVWIYS